MSKELDEEPLTPSEANNDSDKEARKRKIKKVLIIVAPIMIALAAAIFFFLFVIKGNHQPTEEVKQPKSAEQATLESNTYLDIDPITVGLAPSGPKKEYLRLDLTIRLNTEDESKVLLTKMPLIKDSLITFLRSLRATDFNSSNNTLYLKEEITKRINKIAAPITVKEVLFQEITVN
ncbi:MAG: flagellar basal body-associated FliL family protein [Rickettsiales bacterium]|nr:flagellar basal body-associated FliL family protein [Rickettsiales bacterium]